MAFPASPVTSTAVQTINNGTSGNASLTVTSGNLICVAISLFDRTTWSAPTVSDSAGNTYTQRAVNQNTAGPGGVAFFTAPAGTSATVTITITLTSGAGFAAWMAWQESGHLVATPFAASYAADAAFNATSLQIDSGANNPVNALAVSVLGLDSSSGNTNIAVGGSSIGTWSTLGTFNNSAQIVGFGVARQVLSVAAAQRIVWTHVASDEGGSGLLIFLNSAAGGGSGLTNDLTGNGTLPSVGSVSVSSTSITLATGAQNVTVTVLDQYGDPLPNATVTAVSSATGVATVTGSATTGAAGTATLTITAVAGGSATMTVTCASVVAPAISVLVSQGQAAPPIVLRRRKRR